MALVTVAMALLGVVAGALTTLAGMGGGILLLLVMSLAVGPHRALAVTAPALLVSNLHRLWLFRGQVEGRAAGAFALGALPGSVAGGALVAHVAPGLISAAMLATTMLGVGQRLGWVRLRPTAAMVAPAGFAVGAISATAGAAGALVSPVLMATGLRGDAYVAGTALAGVAMHTGRVLAYGASGLIDAETARLSGLLLGALLVGNVAGQGVRRRLAERTVSAIELVTLLACATLAVAGVRG